MKIYVKKRWSAIKKNMEIVAVLITACTMFLKFEIPWSDDGTELKISDNAKHKVSYK